MKIINSMAPLEELYSVIEWIAVYNQFMDSRQFKIMMDSINEKLMGAKGYEWVITATHKSKAIATIL